jgi:hypothetical protein
MLKQSFSTIKKVMSVFLVVLFVVSVTVATVSAKPVMVKEKKTIIIIFQDVKTKVFKHHHHHSKDMDMKKMDMNKMDMNKMDLDIETDDGQY